MWPDGSDEQVVEVWLSAFGESLGLDVDGEDVPTADDGGLIALAVLGLLAGPPDRSLARRRRTARRGAGTSPTSRIMALGLLQEFGPDVLPAWKKAARLPGVGPHARTARRRTAAGYGVIRTFWSRSRIRGMNGTTS